MEFRESKVDSSIISTPSSHSFLKGISYPLLTTVFNWPELVSHSPVLLQIVKEAYPDHTQFDQKDPHYDSSSRKENPKWSMVM